ncbi:heterokaryon incompatibility protein-domain-containing protein [Diaporthe sp. PMI_573]|nr:heterokaryon incompatibility protein-domain-containing protein [Diaporthaceae sp. PMI_573]
MATSKPVPDTNTCIHHDDSSSATSTTGQPLQFVDDWARFPTLELDSDRKEIRILHLLPHSTRENIVCELHVESLSADPCPTYEALSYCWGSPNDPVSVTVNGSEFRITQNLNAALRSLVPDPGSTGPRKLWIDAICINQGHSQDALSERAVQVILMGDIYTKASSVTAYLGEPFQGLGQAMSYLETSAFNRDVHFDPEQSLHHEVDGMNATSEPLSQALETFFSFPWWTRMWIVQEYCLAQRLFFQIGNKRLLGNVCASAVQHFFEHRVAGCCDHRSFPQHGQLLESGGRLPDVWSFFSRLQSLGGVDKTQVLDGLGRFSGRDAGDPRDKIFALRAMCTEPELIRVEYKICARCVFVDFTLRWIEKHNKLTILNYLGLPAEGTCAPSFAVNWGYYSGQGDLASWHRRVTAQAGLFKACNNTQPSWSFHSADSVTANGFIFDAVKTVVNGFHGDFYDPDSFGGWLHSTKFLLRDLVYRNARDAMIRTTCSDLMFKDDEFRRMDGKHNFLLQFWRDEVLRLFSTNQARPPGMKPQPHDYPHMAAFNVENISTIREPITTSALGRRLMVTKKGYIGLAPHRCQPGDHVAILAGGAVPFVLRKNGVGRQDNESVNLGNGSAASYEVIGDAYVHGIMDGEAFKICRRDEEQMDKLILV